MVFNVFVLSTFYLLQYLNFTDFWSFGDLPKHQNEMHRFCFSPFLNAPDGIWGRPSELLKASWPPRRPRCPQELQRRLQEASQTPPEASQRHPRDVQEAEKLFQNRLFDCFVDFFVIGTIPCLPIPFQSRCASAMLQLRPGGMREAIKSGHPRAAWAPVSNVKNESFSSNIKLQGPRAFCRAPWRTREGRLANT